jgi:hypothetical protein
VNDKDLKRRLDTLGASVPVSPKIARVRALFDHIDAALRRGATRQDVLDVLNNDALDMTMASFKSALQRIRAERKVMQADATTNAPADTVVDVSDDKAASTSGSMGEAMADLFARRTFRRWDGRQ